MPRRLRKAVPGADSVRMMSRPEPPETDLPPQPTVSLRSVHRAFAGNPALAGVNLVVPEGSITVLLGPNGAGKTTAIRMITGALTADAGEVRTFGLDPTVDGEEVRRRCGIVSAKPALYDRLDGWDNMRYSAELYGLGRNADVDVRVLAAERSEEQLDLYKRYLGARHRGGGMDEHGGAEFDQFLIGSWNEGRFIEFREHATHRLLAVAITDVMERALSAVYTFYDPDERARGLGTLAILKQIEWARREGREHLYLGYWIAGHMKMDYKRRFQPLEGFTGHHWQRLQFEAPPP